MRVAVRSLNLCLRSPCIALRANHSPTRSILPLQPRCRTLSAWRPACCATQPQATPAALAPMPQPASRNWQRGSRSARRHATQAVAAGGVGQTGAADAAFEQRPLSREEALSASLRRTTRHWSELVAELAPASSASSSSNAYHAHLQHRRQRTLDGATAMQLYQDATQGGGGTAEAVLAQWRGAALQRPAGFDREARMATPGIADAATVTRGGRYRGVWKGVNQDAFALAVPAPGKLLLTVGDGHGPGGELASRAAAHGLSSALRELLGSAADNSGSSSSGSSRSGGGSSGNGGSSSGGGEGSPALQRALVGAFQSVAAVMQRGDTYSQCGTAVVACLVEPGSITAAWAGDCRAVLGMSVATPAGPRCLVHALTTDHKPGSPLERARIAATGQGRVVQTRAGGPYRIAGFAVSSTTTLSLSRSFGDTWALPLGLTAEPDAVTLTLPPPVAGCFASAAAAAGAAGPLDSISSSSDGDDARAEEAPALAAGSEPARHVLLLGSDGLWDVLSNKEAVAIAMSCESAKSAAHALMHAAMRRWAADYGGLEMDDVTVAVAFLPC